MYKTLSEMLLEKGLYQISILDLLALPEEQDCVVRAYLGRLLEIALDEDGDGDGLVATEEICTELERLWDEGVELTVEDGEVTDLQNFWRVMVMLPILFFREADVDDAADEDDDVALSRESMVNALRVGFSLCRDIPLEYSDFEAVLMSMPDGAQYDFLMGLDDEARLQCLMRLALADDGWLFQMDEEMLRAVLLGGGSMVRNSMLQMLDGLGVELTLVEGAPCDPAWSDACGCAYCIDGICICHGCCAEGDELCVNCPFVGHEEMGEAEDDGVHEVTDLPGGDEPVAEGESAAEGEGEPATAGDEGEGEPPECCEPAE